MKVDDKVFMDFVTRIETINDEITDLNAEKKEIMTEAKSKDIPAKAINYAVRQRKKDRDEIAEDKEIQADVDRVLGL